ncbi:hypothetical protein [Sphingomonas sp.]|jgi:signal transduction histidine kinase|uniref:sensor histidine kinase n=1 Tax=Sphingomonas sp. TaxID=28214 RepID=UPI002ED97553
MMEERLRIARDLHNDVGARLMTSLHRSDGAAMRQDVRDAMADIRLIVGNLAGDTRQLGEVLADVRHEVATRLSAAGVALDWPVETTAMSLPDMLSGADARHLTSIVRELVSNTIRHAQAHVIVVTADATTTNLSLVVADDGTSRRAPQDGNGPDNMRRRAEALGGEIVFTGPPEFSAIVSVPRGSSHVSPDDGMAALVDAM